MAFSVESYAMSRKYTDETVVGGGAIKGKNCTIDSITPITGGNEVTFKWTLDDGTVQTDTMDVMDGEDGKGIKRVYVNEEDHLIIVYDDDTTSDAGEIVVQSSVDSVNGKTGVVTLDLEDVVTVGDNLTYDSETNTLSANAQSITVDSEMSNSSENPVQNKVITGALADKVDKVQGKGLSTNDYDNTAKGIVDGVTSALADKVDKNGTDSLMTADEHTKLSGIATGAEVNVQSDWEEADSSSDAYIANKPTIPSAQVNSDWTASSGVAEILHKPTLGTAAAKNSTNSVTSESTDLVESGAVKTAIDSAISSVYKASGDKTCAELISSLLVAGNLGNVYNITDSGTTTSDFVGGAGKAINVGDNVAIVDVGSSTYKFDLLAGLVDLSNYVQKSSTAGLLKNDGTVDPTSYATESSVTAILDGQSIDSFGDVETALAGKADTSDIPDITGKADKVTSAVNGNLAGLDENGNLTDSGIPSVTTLTSTDPYTYRQGKGNLADIEIEGASVGWNQLVQNGNFASTSGWNTQNGSLSVSNNNALVTCTTDNKRVVLEQTIQPILNHKYLVSCKIKFSENSSTKKYNIGFYDNFNASTNASTSEQKLQFVFQTDSNDVSYGKVWFSVTNAALNDTLTVSECNVFDLTQDFGSATIADHIYSLEQAQAGSGIAWIKKYGFFSKDYYAYDAGSIQSVCVGSRKVVGKNLQENRGFSQTVNNVTFTVNNDGSVTATGKASADTTFRVQSLEQTSCIQKAGNYILSIADTNGSNPTFQIVTYARHNNNPLMFDIISNDREVAVSLNEDPTNWYFGIRIKKNYNPNGKTFYPMIRSAVVENGTWEPYNPNQYEYPFDSTKELRGMFSLVGGELKANGDVYTADGNIQRYWLDPVDLGTLDWTKSSGIANSFYSDEVTGIKKPATISDTIGAITSKYAEKVTQAVYPDGKDKVFCIATNGKVHICDSAYADADVATFKTAMSGVYLIAERATPTTETAQSYQNPQRAYNDGTEEFTDGLTRDVMIPVGNNTTYQQDKILPSVEDYVDAVAEVVKADILTTTKEEENVDLDTLTTPGMYFVKNSDAGSYNYPSSVTSGVLTVIHYKQSGETMIRQELQGANYLCYRNGMWSNGSWVFGAGWFVFTGTI